MLPTFLIVGARKSGTTTLWRNLAAHPDVAVAKVKEPDFLTRSALPSPLGETGARARYCAFDRGLAWYEGLFPGSDGARAVGKASNAYLWTEDAARFIRETVPNVRLIFLFRDPVERI